MFFYTQNTHKLCEFNTADKICEAALTLFAQQGFFNTSMHHIQKESKISIGAIYHHFKDKKGIASALQENILAQMDVAFIDVINQHKTFEEKYFNIVKLLLVMTEEEPRTMKFIFHSKYSEYSDLNKSIFQSKPFQNIHHEMTSGCENDAFNQQECSIDLIMATLFSLPIQLIQLRLDGVIKKPITDRAELIYKVIWDGLCSEFQNTGKKISD
ncbi:MAG: hypothetical protein Ctma_1197 [Catillopecten margaritatus gill symbiont]|uniref:HTH tetR-type domain-containing protein n=1 Tax=Catillopecten margaritatus gill symbiont TaxID=3083288 RepID=A0AAU6PHG3_9GAMM